MKQILISIIILSGILCGCKDMPVITDSDQVRNISISILNTVADMNSATVSIHALGADLDDYESWGITYSETEDLADGTDVRANGKPSDGKTDIRIEGLEAETTYYIRAWAETKDDERIWALSHTSVTTKIKENYVKLSGNIIGSTYSVDYSTGQQSLEVNAKSNVFDGNFETFFASYDRSGTWVGLDLGSKHVIRQIGYSPRVSQEHRVQLAIIEGANEPDFSDALPIFMIKNGASSRQMHYGYVNCSKGFRYVRYVSPNDVRCNLAELEFYGFEGEGDDSQMYQVTNLPTVVINTENAEEIVSKEEELSSNVYIISKNGTDILATSETGVRGRGNASWLYFPKKPYRLKFKSKQSPLGAPASAKKWTLISNYSDKSLMRNILAFEASRRIGQAYTPYCHPVDVIVNGEYRGCYQLCDQVEAAEGRVPAKDGYLIEIDAYAYKEESMFYSWRGTPVTIKHPDEDEITPAQSQHIESFFNQMETAALSANFTDPQKGYRKYLDLESFLRNLLVGDFCGNTDLLWSVYMYKDATDGKLYAGPTWDHDLSFDNDYRSYPVNANNDFIFLFVPSPASDAVRDMTRRIIKEDPEAKELLAQYWNQALEEGDLKSLPEYLDQTYILLQESQELNFKRWNILNQKVHMNFQALGTYEAEVNFLKNCVKERLEKFDEYVRNNK